MISPLFYIAINCFLSYSNYIVTGDLILSSLSINSRNATKITTSNKLLVTTGQLDTVFLKNTGTSLEYFSEGTNVRGEISGSTLGVNRYRSTRTHFSFNVSSSGNTGVLVDGEGAALTLDLFYYNKRYENFEQASTKADGLVILRLLVRVESSTNLLFTPLEPYLERVKKPGTLVAAPDFIVYPWFNSLPLVSDYFEYRGLFKLANGFTNYATVFLISPKYSFSISKKQFDCFLKIENNQGEPLTNEIRKFKQGSTRVTHVYGKAKLVILPGRL